MLGRQCVHASSAGAVQDVAPAKVGIDACLTRQRQHFHVTP